MVSYIKQKLEQGYYIASHGRFESSTGRRGAMVGGITLMTKEGIPDYEINPRHFRLVMESMELVGLDWGSRNGQGGGTEYRTKKWHEVEVNGEQ